MINIYRETKRTVYGLCTIGLMSIPVIGFFWLLLVHPIKVGIGAGTLALLVIAWCLGSLRS